MGTEELDKLIDAFAKAAAHHYALTQLGNAGDINREADKIDNAYRAIRAYGEDGKRALLTLLDVDDLAVATMAAAYCMHFAPEACKKMLQRAARVSGIIGWKARYALKRFEDESWRVEPK